MVLIEFSMSPTDKGESLSPYISRIINHIDDSGITYQLTPMGTILEGDWEEVIKVVSECFYLLKDDCRRIGMNLKMDYREGSESRMVSKIEKVENLADKSFKK